MKIKKYVKKKDGLYNIVLENGDKLSLYEDVILNNNLLITKDISKENIDNIINENKFYSCYFRALKLIKARLRSKKEMSDKLKQENFDYSIICKVIEKLEKQGYLNDSFYATSYVNNQIITTYHGPKRIYSDLKKKGVSDNLINDALENYDIDTQKEKALKIANKMNKSNRSSSSNSLKRKINSKLTLEGFSSLAINYAISNTKFSDDKEIYIKEYDKVYKRLSRKYSGYELDMKIKEYLYRKGF